MKQFLLLLGVFTLTQCGPVHNEDSAASLVHCLNSDMSLCLKEHALRAVERIRTLRQIKLTDSLTLINNGNPNEIEPAPTGKALDVNRRLWKATTELLQNSDLEYTFPEDGEQSRAIEDVEESRGKKKEKKKKLKLLISLAILAKIKAVALVVFALLVIAASLFKLAVLAKIAFIAKLIAIIKALLAKKHEQHEEHWIPHHEEHHEHSGWDSGASAGWSRSRNEAQNLAYAAHRK